MKLSEFKFEATAKKERKIVKNGQISTFIPINLCAYIFLSVTINYSVIMFKLRPVAWIFIFWPSAQNSFDFVNFKKQILKHDQNSIVIIKHPIPP